jgi:hypothetical protein
MISRLHFFQGVRSLGNILIRFRLAGEMQRVCTEVLLVGPLNAAEAGLDLLEVVRILEFDEDAFVEVGGGIKAFDFAVVEEQAQGGVGHGFDLDDFGRHGCFLS